MVHTLRTRMKSAIISQPPSPSLYLRSFRDLCSGGAYFFVVLQHHLNHVVHRVPMGLTVARNEADVEAVDDARITPRRERYCCRVDESECKLPDLKKSENN